jgi:hypothetical protein
MIQYQVPIAIEILAKADSMAAAAANFSIGYDQFIIARDELKLLLACIQCDGDPCTLKKSS